MNIACAPPAVLLSVGISAASPLQDPPSKAVHLPSSARLSDVEIRWESGGGDGCPRAEGCSHHRITLHGEGFIELEELPWPAPQPKPPIRRRSISPDEIVRLVNEFFKAHFFEASDHYHDVFRARRTGDALAFTSSGGIGAGWVDLTLRINPAAKTVRLEENTPAELTALKDEIWRIGGPSAWAKAAMPVSSSAPATGKPGVCMREASPLVGRRPERIDAKIPPPRRTRDAAPKYPPFPPGTSASGIWMGEVLVDSTGKVARVWTIREVHIAPPLPAFNKSIVDAIVQWEFEPRKINNDPLPFCITVTMNIDWQ
jgi:hypothetical protein